MEYENTMRCLSTGKTLIVFLEGDIDHHNARPIRSRIDTKVYIQRPDELIIDLSHVSFMDSSGLGLILGRAIYCGVRYERLFFDPMGDYIGLLYDEDAYKKAVKAGFAGVLIASDGYHMTWWKLPESHVKLSDKELLALYDDEIKKEKESFRKEDKFTKHTLAVYRSSDDFNLGEPIKLEDIMAEIAS